MSISRKFSQSNGCKEKTQKIFRPIIRSIREAKMLALEPNAQKRLVKINDSFGSVRFDRIALSPFFSQPCILMPHSRKLCDAGEMVFWASTAFLCSNFLLLPFFLFRLSDITPKSCNLVANIHTHSTRITNKNVLVCSLSLSCCCCCYYMHTKASKIWMST